MYVIAFVDKQAATIEYIENGVYSTFQYAKDYADKMNRNQQDQGNDLSKFKFIPFFVGDMVK